MLRLRQSPSGQLQCRRADDAAFVDVRLRPCFPLTQPGRYLSLQETAGEQELALVKSLDELDASSRAAMESALAGLSFLMEITAIASIEDGPALREWAVETTQGTRRFLTQLDSWPRKLDSGGVLIQDVSEDLYLVRDLDALDARSRELLWSYVD